MVRFKKDKDKESLFKVIIDEYMMFIHGFIIGAFLITYIFLHVINEVSKSREVINNEPSNVTEPESKDYHNEEMIINNLVASLKSFEDHEYIINSITADSNYIYISATADEDYLYLFKSSLNDKDINEYLESLLSSSTSIDHLIDIYDMTVIPTIDITKLDIFKNDNRYKGYQYKININYYMDDLYERIAISTIGYKNNEYIVISRLIYNMNNNVLMDIEDGYKSIVNDPNSEYYKVIDYLYNK